MGISNAWNKEKAIEKLIEIVEKGSNHERLAAIRQLNLLLGLNSSQQLENAEQLDGKIEIELVQSKGENCSERESLMNISTNNNATVKQ